MKLNNNLKNFYTAGIYWAIFYAITFTFLRAYALELGASKFFIGIIGAVPYLAIFLSEIPGARLGNFYDNKKLTVLCVFLNRFFWVLIILSAFFYPQNPLVPIIFFYFLSEIFNWLCDPPWTAIVAEIVPKKSMGRYFGYRLRATEVATIVTTVITGFFLERILTGIVGFNLFFSIAIVFGLVALYYFNKIQITQKPRRLKYSLKEFFKAEGNFKKLLNYSLFFNFAYMIASPFFMVYLLETVKLGYDTYSLIISLETIAMIFAQLHFGKLSDVYGDKVINFFSVICTAFVPFFYLFINESTAWLLLPVSILSGVAWGGYNLTSFNLLLDNTSDDKREVQVASYQTFVAIPMIIAPLLGGWIADNVTIIFSGIPLIFFISFILRLLSGFFVYRLQETRVKSDASLAEALKQIVHIHPFNRHQILAVRRFLHFKKK
ncbi:MFS transporter [archaeon]|nr:MFS transporter [archaeon]